MRLHNLFLSAAVFLFVGIVFTVAEESTDKDRGNAQAVGSPFVNNNRSVFPPFHDAAGSKNLTITLLQYRDSAKTEGGRTAYTPGVRYRDLNTALSKATTTYHTDNENERHVYDFAVPFDYSVTKELGITERNDSDRASSPTEADRGKTDAYQMSDNGAYSILVFGKKSFKDGMNRPQIISGGFKSDNFEAEKKVTAHPLSIPLMILVFSLLFFIFLVLSTMDGLKMDD